MKKSIAVLLFLTLLFTFPISTNSVNVSAASPQDNLIAYYNFEDSAYPGKDVSGSGNHLYSFKQSGTYQYSQNAVSLDTGFTGKAAKFNGDNGLMAVPDSSGSDFMDKLTTGLTVAFCVKLDVNSIPSGPHIRIMDNGVTVYNGQTKGGFGVETYFAGKSGGAFNIWPSFRDGKGLVYAPAGNLQHTIDYDYDNWHKIWITCDNSVKPAVCKLYIDGNWTQKTLQISSGLNFKEPMFNFNIGGQVINLNGALNLINDNSTGAFMGWIDELMVFNKALSQDELKNLQISAKSVANPSPYVNKTPSKTNTTVTTNQNNTTKAQSNKITTTAQASSSQDNSSSSISSTVSETANSVADSSSSSSAIPVKSSSPRSNAFIWIIVGILAIAIINAGIWYFLFFKKKKV